MCRVRDGWRECLDFHLDGRWDDRAHVLPSEERSCRVFLQPADVLADCVSSKLAWLEPAVDEDGRVQGNRWSACSMQGDAVIEFPMNQPVKAEFYGRGKRLGELVLPGGKPVRAEVRIFEKQTGNIEHDQFVLIGYGSGAYRAKSIFIDVPQDWRLEGKDSNAKIEIQDFVFAGDRRLYHCEGIIIVEAMNGDRFLIRTGQAVDQKDRLSIDGQSVRGVWAIDRDLLAYPFEAVVEEGGRRRSRRSARPGEVCWRFVGERDWREDYREAGPGYCEFVWLDGETKHVRGRQSAVVLPDGFELIQKHNGAYADIELAGWSGEATLYNGDEILNKISDSVYKWRVFIDPPRRALLCLQLATSKVPCFRLNVPLPSKEWLTTWDGKRRECGDELSLADLRDTVARAPGTAILMGEVANCGAASPEARWEFDRERGLSAMRDDIAALMRPLGLDVKVRLNFNGENDIWFVTEFGNELEEDTSFGSLCPKKVILDENVRICGRSFGTPEKEEDFGPYNGLNDAHGARPIQLPHRRASGLVYLRKDARVLTRPKLIEGDRDHDISQHRLGRAMAQPQDRVKEELEILIDELNKTPETPWANRTIKAVIDLALSLKGLPPKTFYIFEMFEKDAGIVAPLLLYRCELKNLSEILDLFNGLCSSWTLLSKKFYFKAFETQGKFFVNALERKEQAVKWALEIVKERQKEIVARHPQLTPLICQDFSPLKRSEVEDHFSSHTSEIINHDSGKSNPFRCGDLCNWMLEERGVPAVARVFDAPFAAAACTSFDHITLDNKQILAVKDVERHHPDWFAKAYGYAVKELSNGRP